jgi:tRNA/rRNA methyltransferase
MPLPLQPPAVILVRPQLPENIGAAARAMANFGSSDLRLVDPRPFDQVHAARMACDGRDILEQARIFPDLRSAIADCVFTIATSRRLRRVKIPPLAPSEAVTRMTTFSQGQPTALVFGAEQSGLTNEELFLCDTASTIPTTDLGSLNLGQSVVVFLYEWFKSTQTQDLAQGSIPAPADPMATHADKQRSYDLLEQLLIAAEYKPLTRLPEFMRRVKFLFETRPLTHREQKIFLKFLRYIEKLVPPKRR